MRAVARAAARAVAAFFAAPVRDLLAAMDRALAGRAPAGHASAGHASAGRGAAALAVLLAGAALGWWLYVPLHELLHAAGCLATGGDVTRLELAPLYGGTLLARWIPWVVANGPYAGRLAGFDTHGNDLVYLATDLAPFLLVLPGIWLLRRARRPLTVGLATPFALAPFLSLTGDAYEIGSILVTRLPPWRHAASALRADDLPLLVERAWESASFPWGGLVLATTLGVAWAFATYGVGGWLVTKSSLYFARTSARKSSPTRSRR